MYTYIFEKCFIILHAAQAGRQGRCRMALGTIWPSHNKKRQQRLDEGLVYWKTVTFTPHHNQASGHVGRAT